MSLQLDGLSGAIGKKFYSLEKAEDWLRNPDSERTKRKKNSRSSVIAEDVSDLIRSERRRHYPDSPSIWTEFEDHPRTLPSKANAAVQATTAEACVQTDEPFVRDTSPIRIQGSPPPLPTPRGSPERDYPTPAASVPPELADARPDDIVPANIPAGQTAIELSLEQRLVLDLVKTGKNVFFTGPAGTGKSVLLREIIQVFKDRGYTPAEVAITAPTGIASVNVGGSTIYSWAGIGLGNESAKKLVGRICCSLMLKNRWLNCSTLIIDEISMLDGELFDKLEYIARKVRHDPRPFGGIQACNDLDSLIISGDFFQLPPVPNKSHNYHMPPIFAFDSQSWDQCIGKPILLTKVFRQRDNEFIDILSAMRLGELEQAHVDKLRSLSRPVVYPDGIEPTYIFPLRAEVESCNNSRLAQLEGASQTYNAVDAIGWDPSHRRLTVAEADPLLERLVAPAHVSLKVGAQVMLIQNVIQGVLVNGSTGRVEEFCTIHEAIERHIAIAQIKITDGHPHGTTDDGKPYIRERPIGEMEPKDQTVFTSKQRYPLVLFTNGCRLLCAPLMFTVEGVMGNIEVSRMQVPLILAWALSVHKSQGQTLQRVKVDLGRTFEKGQGINELSAYVAVSRATSMEGLEIVNFQPSKVQAHPRVQAWQASWAPPVKKEPSDEDEMDMEDAIASYYAD
ncbi:DNA repair and recombination protein pif1 [Schizophyllum fasciatum]